MPLSSRRCKSSFIPSFYRAKVFIPPFSFTTDNAAMIAEAGYFKYLDGNFCPLEAVPFAKTKI